MLQASDHIKIFSSKEEPLREVKVEFDQAERFNALITEDWCPLSARLKVSREPACKKTIIVKCETDAEALRTAEYHYYSSGSNFKIIIENGSIDQKL